MTCRQSLPAPGSMAAHDALLDAFAHWRLAQEACEALPDNPTEAAFADVTWALLEHHAFNCGFDRATHGELENWAAKRIVAWARTFGIKPADVPGIQIGRA